jgi:hypothetical protein
MLEPAYEGGKWTGIPYGLVNGKNTNKYTLNYWPELGILIKNGTPYKSRPYDVFFYEEVCFLKAETYLRGFATGGSAREEYEKGVRASFTTWGVSDKAAEYLTSTAKNLAGTNAKFDNTSSSTGNT